MFSATRSVCNSNYQQRFTSISYHPKENIESILAHHIENFNSQFENQIHHINVEEVTKQIKYLYQDDNHVYLFPKSQTGLKHSFLVFKNHQGDTCLFIKPKSKNKNFLNKTEASFEHEEHAMEIGAFKIVKTTGLLITLSHDHQNCSVERYVSLSQDKENQFKNLALERLLGEELRKEGFTQIKFWDVIKNLNRTIYIMPYHGERIDSGWLKISDDKLKKNLILELIQQVKITKPNDIKYPNTLFSTKDNKITFIDTHTPSSTYTPWGHERWKGKYAYHANREEIARAITKVKFCKRELEDFILIKNFLTERIGKIDSFQTLARLLDQVELQGIILCDRLAKMIIEEGKCAQYFSIDLLISKMTMHIKKLAEYISAKEFKLTPASESVFEEARIFSLTLLLWELINPKYQNSLLRITMYNAKKPEPDLFNESVKSLLKINEGDDLPPFTDTLRLAYARSLSYDQLKSAIEDLFP